MEAQSINHQVICGITSHILQRSDLLAGVYDMDVYIPSHVKLLHEDNCYDEPEPHCLSGLLLSEPHEDFSWSLIMYANSL
jgi:hypothetical protein